MSKDFCIGFLCSAAMILGALYLLYTVNSRYLADYIDRKSAIKQINKAIYKSNDEAEVELLRRFRGYLEALPRV